MQNLVQMRNTISDTNYRAKSLKPNIDAFTDGSSNHLLSVSVKVLKNVEGFIVQNKH